MGNDSNHTAADLETADCVGHRPQGFWIERPEAFVDEQAVQMHRAGDVLDLIAEREGERQRCQEGFTATESVNAPPFAGVVVIDNEDAVVLKRQPVAITGQPSQVARTITHQAVKSLFKEVGLKAVVPQVAEPSQS